MYFFFNGYTFTPSAACKRSNADARKALGTVAKDFFWYFFQ